MQRKPKAEIFRKHEIQTRITYAEKKLGLFQLEDDFRKTLGVIEKIEE